MGDKLDQAWAVACDAQADIGNTYHAFLTGGPVPTPTQAALNQEIENQAAVNEPGPEIAAPAPEGPEPE
jgi:hypothetical protein